MSQYTMHSMSSMLRIHVHQLLQRILFYFKILQSRLFEIPTRIILYNSSGHFTSSGLLWSTALSIKGSYTIYWSISKASSSKSSSPTGSPKNSFRGFVWTFNSTPNESLFAAVVDPVSFDLSLAKSYTECSSSLPIPDLQDSSILQ